MTAEPDYTWTIHPAREQPWTTVAVLGSLLVCSYSIAVWGGHWAWGIFAATVFAWTLQQFWWPTNYVIDRDGLHIRMGLADTSVTWSEVVRLTVDEHGGLVRLQRQQRRFLEPRELTLRFAGNRTALVESVRRLAPEVAIEDRQQIANAGQVSSQIEEGTIA